MAIFNEIGIGRWNRFIQKLTDIKGGPPARQLSSEIAFTHPISHGVENRYLEGWDRFGVNTEEVAVAASFSAVQIRNPAGSNVIVVVEKLTLFASVATQVVLANGITADLANIDNNRRLDGRGRSAATAITSHAAVAGTGNVFFRLTLGVNAMYDYIVTDLHETAILPGDGINISTGGQNLQLDASWVWRERFLEPAERT